MDPITDTKLTDKPTENQDHFNSIHDQSPNTNQGNSVVLHPLYSEEQYVYIIQPLLFVFW